MQREFCLPELFDSHCHLGWDSLSSELDQVLARARRAGVSRLIDVGIDIASSKAAIERCRKKDGIFPTAGLHPNDCSKHEEQFATVEELCSLDEVVAVGETGLDYFRDHVSAELQKSSLEKHLALAKRLDKAVILHCRDAFEALFDVLAAHAGIRGVLHCFTAGVEEARRGLDLGLHVSFAGPLTYPRNGELRKAAAFVPLDRLLIETDAPFLPPQKYRGKGNEPAYVRLTFDRLVLERGEESEEIAAAVCENAERLFGLRN